MLRLSLTASILVSHVLSVKMRHRFIFADSSKCIGCLSCELACAAANAGISFQEAYATAKSLISRNRVVKYEGKTAPLQCMHCEDASCMAVCPHGVIEKMDDFIRLNEDACVGCGTCVRVCPYGALSLQEKNGRTIAQKCNLCSKLPTGPSCIKVCTTDAIRVVDYEEFESLMRNKA